MLAIEAMLKIIKTETDGLTGHLTVHAQVIEKPSKKVEILGAKETHGIAAQAIQEQYNGNITEWLKTVHRKMLVNHESRKITTKALQDLQGLTLFDDEESNGNRTASA